METAHQRDQFGGHVSTAEAISYEIIKEENNIVNYNKHKV